MKLKPFLLIFLASLFLVSAHVVLADSSMTIDVPVGDYQDIYIRAYGTVNLTLIMSNSDVDYDLYVYLDSNEAYCDSGPSSGADYYSINGAGITDSVTFSYDGYARVVVRHYSGEGTATLYVSGDAEIVSAEEARQSCLGGGSSSGGGSGSGGGSSSSSTSSSSSSCVVWGCNCCDNDGDGVPDCCDDCNPTNLGACVCCRIICPLAGITSTIQSILSAFGDDDHDGWPNFLEPLQQLIDGIVNGITSIINGIINFFRRITQAINDAVTSAIEFLQQLGQGIVSGLRSIGEFLASIPRGIIDGLKAFVDGVANALGSLFDAIGQSEAARWIRDNGFIVLGVILILVGIIIRPAGWVGALLVFFGLMQHGFRIEYLFIFTGLILLLIIAGKR